MKSIAFVVVSLGLGTLALSAAEGEVKPRPTPSIPEWAKPYDKNGDGKLDPSEREAAMKARREDMMKKYDKNGDGKLDPEETKAMNESRQKEREANLAKRKAAQDGKKEEKKEENK